MAAQRDWFEKDYYALLGVPETASAKEITKAYRKLARELHPDANPGDKAAEERFKEVSAAYDVLGDDAKRKEYDEVRKMGPVGGMFGRGGAGGPGGASFNVGADDLSDLLGGLFNRGRRGPAGPGRGGLGPRRGGDLTTTLSLSFDDAAHGATTSVHLTSDAMCSTCTGSGASPGSQPRVCGVCAGRGVTDDNQGFFSFSTPCVACAGRGSIIDKPCQNCLGRGIERRPREVKVRIPAGMANGQSIRIKERGEPGVNGGPAGDLIVECRVAPHPYFTRDGYNLVLRVPITYTEAVAGAEIDVPTLGGGAVKLRLKPGTQPGSKHRVRGKGIEAARDLGDLIIIVDIVVPSNPTAAEIEAARSLSSASSMTPRAGLWS